MTPSSSLTSPAPALTVTLSPGLDLNLDSVTHMPDLVPDTQDEGTVPLPADIAIVDATAAPAHDDSEPVMIPTSEVQVDRLELDWPSTPNQSPSPPPMSPPPVPASVLMVKRPLTFPTLTGAGAGDSPSSVAQGVAESSLSLSISSIHSHHLHAQPLSPPPLGPVHIVPVTASVHASPSRGETDLPTTPKSTVAPASSSTSSPSPNRTATLTTSKKPALGRASRPARPRSTSIPAQTPLSPTLSATSTSRTAAGSRAPKPARLHRQRRGSTSTLASATTSLYSTSTANVPAYAGAPTRPGGLVHHSIKRVSAAYEPDGMGPVPKFPDQDMARLVVRHAPPHEHPGSEVGDSVSMIHAQRHGSASISILTQASGDSGAALFPMSTLPAAAAAGHGHVCLWEMGVCCHEWTDPNPSVRRSPRVCGMRFNSGDALYKHLTEHHVETGTEGTRCGHCHWRGCCKVFRNTSKYLRRDHFKKHITELVEYVCLDCGRVCDKEYGSGRHICRESNPLPTPRATAKGSEAAATSTSVASAGSTAAKKQRPTSVTSPAAATAKPVALHVNNSTQHHHHHDHRHAHEGDLHVHFGDAATPAPPADRAADDTDSLTKASSSVEEWVRNDALAAIRHHQLKQQQRSPLGISDEDEAPAAPVDAAPARVTLAALPPGISPAEFLAHHVDPALVQELARMVSTAAPPPAPSTSEWGIQTSPQAPMSPHAPATSPTAPADPLAHYAELATTTLAHLSTLHAQADAQAEAIQHLLDAQAPLRAVPATLVDVVQALSAVAGAHQGVATRLAKVEEGVASAAGSVGGGSRRQSEDREGTPEAAVAAAAASFRFAPVTDAGESGDEEDDDKEDSAYASAPPHAEAPNVAHLAQQTAAVLEPKLAALLDAHAAQVSASQVELTARLEMLESAAVRREQQTAALVEHVPATIMAAVAKQLAAMEARLAGLFARTSMAGVEKRDAATSMSPPASPRMRGWSGPNEAKHELDANKVEGVTSPPVSLLSELIHQASASSLVGPTLQHQASAPTSPTTEAASSSAAAESNILSFFTSTRSRTLERYEPKKVIVPITLATPGSPTFSTAFSLSSSTNVAGQPASVSGDLPPVPEPKSPTAPSRALPADTVSAPVRHRHPAWTASPQDSVTSPKGATAALAEPTSPASPATSSPRTNSLKRLSIIPTPPSTTPPPVPRAVFGSNESNGHLPTPQSSNSVASSATPSRPDAAQLTSPRLSDVSVQSAPAAAALTSPIRRPLTLGYSALVQVDIPHAPSPPSPSVSPTRSMIAIPTHHDDGFATLRSVQSVTVGTMTKAKKKRGMGRVWQAMARALGGGKKKDADRVSVSSAPAGTASGRYVAGSNARRV